MARFELDDGTILAAVRNEATGAPWIPFDLSEAYDNFVTERWRERVRVPSLSGRQLALYYRAKPLVPRSLQLAARRVLARRQSRPVFPAWPFEGSLTALLRFYAHCVLVGLDSDSAPFRWFWPKQAAAALILTHDVESAEGLRFALRLADLEESRGFRSSFNIVASSYPIDTGILAELRNRGFEIGLHGLRHDRSLFASRDAFVSRLPALAAAATRLGAVGFRSPSTIRVHDWLGELPLDYDCSVPHSDPYEPQPGGCCSLWPFFIGSLVELPYTLPQDHTLLTVLREQPLPIWLAQVDKIERSHGLIQGLTHPDPGYLAEPRARKIYAELLDALASRERIWKPLPRELAAWWRRRDLGDPADAELAFGVIRRTDGPLASLEPPAKSADTELP